MLALSPPATSETNGQQVLGTPELLHKIFRYLGPSSNAKNARVCLEWHESALDVLWYHAEGLYNILNILAPMEKSDEDDTFYVSTS